MVKAPSSQPNPDLFDIPAAAVARHPGAMLAARALRRWVDGLPLGNPPKAAQMLLQQLRLLVRDPDPGSRFDSLLQIYATPVGQLFDIVDERLRDSSDSAMPLDQLEYALIELLTELAFGHLRLANDLLEKGKNPPTETLYQAMRLLDGAQTVERLHYCRLVPESWRLVTQIYRHAEARETAHSPVDRGLRRAGDPATIEGLFFRTLIISLCDPHQHRPQDILRWHDWTGPHTHLVGMGILPQGPFAIPVDTSGELAPLTSARRGRPGPEMRYLAIESFLQQLEADHEGPKGLLQALHDLITGRKSSEQRQSPRQPRNHPYSLLRGLRDVHARLETLTRGGEPGSQGPVAVACRQVNQSRTGAAFQLTAAVTPPLSVDDLVLAEAAETPAGGASVGFAGRIRRLVTLDDQTIEIGVEKLQGRLIPVEIGGTTAERLRGNIQALLQHVVENDRYVLIATRNLFRRGDTVTVKGAHADFTLRMKELLAVVHHTAYIAVEITVL